MKKEANGLVHNLPINNENLTTKVSFEVFKKTAEEKEELKKAKKAHKQGLMNTTAEIKNNNKIRLNSNFKPL